MSHPLDYTSPGNASAAERRAAGLGPINARQRAELRNITSPLGGRGESRRAATAKRVFAASRPTPAAPAAPSRPAPDPARQCPGCGLYGAAHYLGCPEAMR